MVLYPGEIEDRAHAQGHRTGGMLPDQTIHDLSTLATSCGVASDLTREAR